MRVGRSGVAVSGQLGLAVDKIEVAGEHGLAFLDHIHVGTAPFARGNDVKLDAIARTVHGAFGAQQDLVLAGAGARGRRVCVASVLPALGRASSTCSASGGLCAALEQSDHGNAPGVGSLTSRSASRAPWILFRVTGVACPSG